MGLSSQKKNQGETENCIIISFITGILQLILVELRYIYDETCSTHGKEMKFGQNSSGKNLKGKRHSVLKRKNLFGY